MQHRKLHIDADCRLLADTSLTSCFLTAQSRGGVAPGHLVAMTPCRDRGEGRRERGMYTSCEPNQKVWMEIESDGLKESLPAPPYGKALEATRKYLCPRHRQH
nr:hypothetical protein CFP56_41462 [Quercus suber]